MTRSHHRHLFSAAMIVACSATASEYVVGAGTELPAGAGVPKRIKLLPIGEVILRDGRGPFQIVDRAHAEQVVEATRQFLNGVDLMIDYDHQALYAVKPGVGGTAIAAGWAKTSSLTVEDDGIYADAEWTEAAAARIGRREYRYLSPAFAADQDKRVLRLSNVALVNIPALIDLPAIAAATSGEAMTFAKIAAALKLGADAGEDSILAAITTMSKPAPLATIAAAVDLAETATAEQIAAAIATLKTPDPARFVPVEQVQTLTTQLGVLSSERADREIAAAVESGKLAPALKDWALSLFKKDESAWAEWLKGAPVIVAAGTKLPTGHPDQDGKTILTEEQVAAATMLDMSEDDYRDLLKQEAA